MQAQAHPVNQDGSDHSPCRHFHILYTLYFRTKKKKTSLPPNKFSSNLHGQLMEMWTRKGWQQTMRGKWDILANAIHEKSQAHLDKHLKFTSENCNQCRKKQAIIIEEDALFASYLFFPSKNRTICNLFSLDWICMFYNT